MQVWAMQVWAMRVWTMDLTCISMARGLVYLAAVVDWFSRPLPAWRVSITMEVAFCLEALEESLSRNKKPWNVNATQGSQFTRETRTST